MITVLTPAYNREKYLTRAYQSLLMQSHKDFEWIVVDDGSQDGTSELIKKFINENIIPIKYIYRSNGGLLRALNTGVQLAQGEWWLWLDSDDHLKSNAIYEVNRNVEALRKRGVENNFFAVIGLCEDPNGKIIGVSFEEDVLEIDYFVSVINRGIIGDKAWAIRTDLLKKYPFPEFEGEKFVTPATWFNEIAALGYQCRFYKVPIKNVEYLSDGMSTQYYQMMADNWQGTLKYYNDFFNYMINNKSIVLNLFQGYLMIAKIAGKSKEQIAGGIDPKVYCMYSKEIDSLLENIS